MRRIKQIEESKKMISDALLRLLQDKSMDEITVSRITKEAKIGRNTFYNHFKKKEDILDYMMFSMLEEVIEMLSNKNNPSIRDFLLWRFTFIKENPLIIVFKKHNDIKQLLFRFRESNSSLFNFSAQNDIYKKEFFQGGLEYITSRWVIGEMKESPDEMADKVLSIMS